MAKAKNAPGAKSMPKVNNPDGSVPDAVELPYNPATDPNKTAQERLDALHEQHEEMQKHPTGEYPL